MHELISISRLRIDTDGQGISTLVGFYGCPLRCKYCINPQCHDESIIRAYYEPEKLRDWLSVDTIYFKMTGGGVTFGGGEPLPHSEYIHEFSRLVHHEWPLRMETSLYGDWSHVVRLADDIDQWIVDIKETNPVIYKKYTLQDNAIVLANLEKLVTLVGPERVRVRVPYIRKFNTHDDVKRSMDVLRPLGIQLDEFSYIFIQR